jgi:hypothetical protein
MVARGHMHGPNLVATTFEKLEKSEWRGRFSERVDDICGDVGCRHEDSIVGDKEACPDQAKRAIHLLRDQREDCFVWVNFIAKLVSSPKETLGSLAFEWWS